MTSLFKQLSDDMEKVIQLVEEGSKFMMGESSSMGGAKEGDASSSSSTSFGDGVEVDPDGDAAVLDDMEDMYGSPLMGMADSVMSDIMSMQVRDYHFRREWSTNILIAMHSKSLFLSLDFRKRSVRKLRRSISKRSPRR